MDGWFYYCYKPVLGYNSVEQPDNFSFIFWEGNDFGLCFQKTALSTTPLALLAAVSGLYAGCSHSSIRRRRPAIVGCLRAAIALFLLLNSLTSLVGSFWLARERPYSVLIAQSMAIFSWVVHLFCWLRLSWSVLHYGWGPTLLNLAWGITLLGSVLQFRTTILHNEDPSAYSFIGIPGDKLSAIYFSLLSQVTCCVEFGLQCLYAVTILFPVPPPTRHDILLPARQTLTLQTEGEERWPLLNGGSSSDTVLACDLSYGATRRAQSFTLFTDKTSPEDKANPLSLLSFWWLQPLMKRGAKGLIQRPADLPQLPTSLSTSAISNKFCKILQKGHQQISNQPHNLDEQEIRSLGRMSSSSSSLSSTGQRDEAASTVSSSTSLFFALNKAFGWHYYPLGLLKLLSDALGFAGPLLLHSLVSFIENHNEPISHGYYYALGLFGSTLLAAVLTAHFNYQMNKVGLKIRAAIMTEVYRKPLAVTATTLSKFSTGEVINFMSTDTDRIVNFCQSFHQFWSLPFQVVVSLFLLYQQVGLAFLAGVLFGVLLIPVNRWLAVKIGKLSTAMMNQKDKRVKMMAEVLAGIRVIKLYAWERTFAKRISQLRLAELKSLKGRKYLDALCVYFWATTPVIISILTFTTYAALGNNLTAAKVFTSVALFNMLISPLNAFPWVLNGLVEAWVSIKRVQAFLSLEELDLAHYYHPYYGQEGGEGGDETVLSVSSGSFTWKRKSGEGVQEHGDLKEEEPVVVKWCLSGINLSIPKGELVGVIGKVGAGKSSLLAAIMGEMRKKTGLVTVADLSSGFAYAGQEPWIQYSTVRENILFGLPYIESHYTQVLHACALEQDLSILPSGDMTEVGENGVTLSGGQKARLALARAVYQDKLVYLLDDPLAAVDAHVASHLFTHCITGLLKKKTVLLCTHRVQFLREADNIIMLDEGKIKLSGPPHTVLPLLEENVTACDGDSESSGEEDKDKRRRNKRRRNGSCERKRRQHHNGGAISNNNHQPLEEVETEILTDVPNSPTSDGGGGANNEEMLVKEEEKEEGVVAFRVYWSYWMSVGSVLTLAIFISLLLMQASRNASDWWLSYWVTHAHNNTSPTDNITWYNITPAHGGSSSSTIISQLLAAIVGPNSSSHPIPLEPATDNLVFYLGIYGGIAVANSVFTFFRAFLYAYGGIRAALIIHKRLLAAILKAPIYFFDTTPIGRIVNRFSSDLYAIDDSLPFIQNILLAQLFGLLGTLVITCYGLPWFIVLLVPLTVLYYHIQKYYRRTSRELKRLSTVTLSPVYAHFSETLSGLSTIRALRASQRFKMENEMRVETNQRANYASYAVGQWLGIRLQMLGVAMVTGVSFIAVLEHHFATVNPGLVGLAISYALSVTNLLSGLVTSFTETEKEMVSVERALQYINGAPSEPQGNQNKTCANWPSRGVVTFARAVLIYRKGHPPALNQVSFETKPAEKIGVVGRTGAGKTSLLQALFRMVELSAGQILIDGVDISTIPLQKLRSSLAIIPQDPFLFSGTVRDNLDPSSTHIDSDLWEALERCHLKRVVQNLGGLEAEVEERGTVFSVGQRQLVCLARALLTQAKVICIDEATASVDLDTDNQIQQTIQTEFVTSTVITIAHRIDTVRNSDRILEMEAGRVKRFEKPGNLFGDAHSLFYSLYSEQMSQRQ